MQEKYESGTDEYKWSVRRLMRRMPLGMLPREQQLILEQTGIYDEALVIAAEQQIELDVAEAEARAIARLDAPDDDESTSL